MLKKKQGKKRIRNINLYERQQRCTFYPFNIWSTLGHMIMLYIYGGYKTFLIKCLPNYPILVSVSPYIKNYGRGESFIYSRTSTHVQCVSHIPTHKCNQAWIQAHVFFKYLWHIVAEEGFWEQMENKDR